MLCLLAAGKRTPEIAQLMGISAHTVAYHYKHAMVMLGVTRVTQLAALAAFDGLVDRRAVTGGR